MKKILAVIIAIIAATITCFSLTACNESGVGETRTDAEAQLKAVPVELSSEEYAFAIKKNDPELKQSVNEFFDAKEAEISAIFDKYTAEGVDLTSFGNSDIKTAPDGTDDELVVATNLDFPPFEYTNGKKIAGIDMEIAQLLADYLNKTLVVVHMDFSAVVTSVATLDTYDIGIAGLTITPDRAESVDFSNPYFGATQMIVVAKNDNTFDGLTTKEEVEQKLASLTGKAAKCGGQKATTSQFYINGNEDFGFAGFANLDFSGYTSAAEAARDMLNGNLSFVVVDKQTANALISNFTE